MTLPEIPTGIERKSNDLLAAVKGSIDDKQVVYFAGNGKYWQGISTHVIIPADGLETSPDKTRKPSDQDDDWSDIDLPSSMHLSIECSTHDGPDGTGYTITGTIVIAGKTWKRHIGEGVHSTTKDWYKQE